ncbi:MAG: hypothetical protein NTW35_00525 [Candidatus Nomurabacteria bacterium]|nr:hypothetical protein [Candidatus Nomurabacteria bacterium]
MNQNFFQSPPTQETEESKLEKNIRIIESLDCNLKAKANMVLVLLGLKPATDVFFLGNNEDLKPFKSKIKETGLSFDVTGSLLLDNNRVKEDLVISKKQEIASLVAFLFKTPNLNRRELGVYMGYPETAINAFVGLKEKHQDSRKVFQDKGISDSVASFILSKDNWQEEIKTAEKWVEGLTLKAPELYKKVMDTEKNRTIGQI